MNIRGTSACRVQQVYQEKGCAGDQGGGGDGKDPGPDDASGDAPADGGQAMDGTDADDSAGDGVSGADGNSGERGAEQSDGSSALGTESAERFELGDFLAHGVDDAPSSEISTGGDGGVSGQNDRPVKVPPVGQHVGFRPKRGGVERAGDNAHGFLRIVAAMAETVCRSGEQLEFAEPLVNRLRSFVLENPVGGDPEDQAEKHAHEGSDDDEDESFVPALGNDDGEHGAGAGVNRGVHHGGPGVSANQGVGRGSG